MYAVCGHYLILMAKTHWFFIIQSNSYFWDFFIKNMKCEHNEMKEELEKRVQIFLIELLATSVCTQAVHSDKRIIHNLILKHFVTSRRVSALINLGY